MPRSRFINGAERLRRLRVALKNRKMSWYGLAREMNMSQGSVWKAFHPKPDGTFRDLRISTLKRAARALDVTVGFLVDRKET